MSGNVVQLFPSAGIAASQIPSFGLDDVWLVLRRHWRALCLFLVMGVFMALAIITFVPSIYEASAVVVVEERQMKINVADDVVLGVTPDATSVLSEIEIIRSRSLAEKVVSDWGLYYHKAFNPDSAIETWPVKTPKVTTPNDNTLSAFEKRRAVDLFMEKIDVQPVGRSLAIEISMRGEHPDMVADLVNALADTYIKQQLAMKQETARSASLWLKQQLDELDTRVAEAASAVENYRSDNNLIDGSAIEITSQQISEVASEIIKSKARVAEASARLDRVNKAIANDAGLSAIAEVVQSPLIQRLQQEESVLMRRQSELATRYGARHPKMINIQAELEELRRKIDLETGKVIDNITSEKEIAEAGLHSMEKSLAELETRKEKQNRSSVHLSRLEQELASHRNLYEDTFLRFEEVSQQAQMQKADSRIISHAAPPTRASFPNTFLMFFLGIVTGILCAGIYILIREQFDYAIRTPSQLEKEFELPVWGMIPAIDDLRGVGNIAAYIINKPYSAAAEAIRSMRVVMAIKRRGREGGRVVSVTSSVPGEGKTTVAVWLSRLVAMSGKRVLLIDCDLRLPKVHESFNRTSVVSLIDVLSGNKQAEDLIERDNKTGLHLIMGKPMQVSHFDLLTSDKMDKLIETLKEKYDLIVLDTPPTLTMADSRFLSRMADDTLFVVQWGRTHKDAVASAIKMFRSVNLNISAFVVNKVNLKEHARYHYNDSGSYYAKYPEYFAN